MTMDRDWRLLQGAAVLLVLALYFWQLGDVLSPLVLFAALVVLLSPFSGTPTHRLLVATLGALLALWLLRDLGSVLAPFVLAFILAFILDPVVDVLEARRVPRSAAIVILTLPVLAGLAVALALGLPALAHQLQLLVNQVPDLLERVASWVESLRSGTLGVDLPLIDEQALSQRIRDITPTSVMGFLEQQLDQLAAHAWTGVLGLGRGLGAVLMVVSYTVLTPVLTFYLLRDWDGIVARMASYVPRDRVDAWSRFAREYERLLDRYLRGQFLEAALVGVLTWLGLLVLGFPSAGLVGAVAGIFNVVPFLGLPVSLIPAIIIAILSGSFLTSLLKVAVVFAVVQFLDGNVMGPRIVGESVGLHPVWVILAIAVAGYFFGFVGLLLAIPGAILVKLSLKNALERYKESAVYLGDAEAEES
jgi:predicted PurR-regulated permease PerM